MSISRSRFYIPGPAIVSAPTTGDAFTSNAANGGFNCYDLVGASSGDDRATIQFTALVSSTKQYLLGISSQGGASKSFDIRDLTRGAVPFSVTTNGDLVARGTQFCLRATSIEQRTSTTTLTNSTQLTYAIPLAGTYAFELVVFTYFTTAVTDGITANVNYSGTFTAVGSYVMGFVMNGTTTTLGIQPVELSSTVNNALAGMTLATYGASVTSAAPACHYLKGNLIATGTGTLAFAFAQSTTGIDTTNLGVGSYMTVTQLS